MGPTYMFGVVVEPFRDRWRAWCPALAAHGASTWGYTRDEALEQLRELLAIIAAELVEQGRPVPADDAADEPRLVITLPTNGMGLAS